jgi:hypothetical protein
VKAFEERHPESVEVLKKIIAEPQSSGFGNTIFHGLNAFLFTNAADKTTPVRWILKPMQPFEAAGAAPPDKNYFGNRSAGVCWSSLENLVILPTTPASAGPRIASRWKWAR